MENPFYAITTCIDRKLETEGWIATCNFKGFFKGKKIKALQVREGNHRPLVEGDEYFLLLEFRSLDDRGNLSADLIDGEKLDEMKVKEHPTI